MKFVGFFRANRKPKRVVPAFDWLKHFRLFVCNRWREFDDIYKKQELDVLYEVCVLGRSLIQKTKMAALTSDWLRHFQLLLLLHWMEFDDTWQKARSQHPLPSLCFSGWSENQDVRPQIRFAEAFSISSLQPSNKFDETWQKARPQRPLPNLYLCFSAYRKPRWPTWILLWNCWTEFDERKQ